MAIKRVKISRRDFLIASAAAGAGLSLGLYLPLGNRQAQAADVTPEVNAWVVIEPDDTVTIRIARSEMGQGTLTGLAQLVAEELECDWSKVKTEYPTPGENLARDRVWGSFSTGGSRGIRGSHHYVREGGALAREMLREAAAEAWDVPAGECAVAASLITHQPTGRTTTYGKVAAAAATLVPPFEIELKDPKDWKLIGKPVKRLDTRDKLTGKQVFGADLQLPGMLNAAINACPVFGGTLASFDADAVRGMSGVRAIMRVGDNAVAVVADTWWQAKTALDALPVTWDEGPNAGLSSDSIAQMLDEGLAAEEAFVGNLAGDVEAALAGADPLDFRRKLMADHPKSLAVLNAAEEKAGWGQESGGVHRGLAVCKAFGSYVAACAEVSVDAEGKLKIHRIVAATDPGYAVNPQQIEAQLEGSFVFGLSAILYGECTIQGGRVQQENFDTYPSMQIAEMPKVETIVMPSGGFWGGVGEPTIAVAAPAVLNAIFAATGKRIRQLPLKNSDLRAA